MTLENALRFNGYTIVQTDVGEVSIPVGDNTIVVPPLRLSSLQWERGGTPNPVDSFYLQALPVFDPLYRPVALSHILDRFADRRLAYDMPGKFGGAVRRWMNLQLGPMSILNQRYKSTAIPLPLTTQDATAANMGTDLARDAFSDLPQAQLSGNKDYATSATDRAAATTDNTQYQGRMGTSVMTLLEEQRAAFLNVDEELLASMEPLFLGVWGQDERDARRPSFPRGAFGYSGFGW